MHFPHGHFSETAAQPMQGKNLTAQAHKVDLSRGPGSRTGEGKEGRGASGGICNLLFAILSDLSCGDRRAPGCEKKVHSLNIFWYHWSNICAEEKHLQFELRWLKKPHQQTMSKRDWWPQRQCITRWSFVLHLPKRVINCWIQKKWLFKALHADAKIKIYGH